MTEIEKMDAVSKLDNWQQSDLVSESIPVKKTQNKNEKNNLDVPSLHDYDNSVVSQYQS